MKKIHLIIEKAGNDWYGRVENIGEFMPVSFGDSIEAVEKKIRSLIKDHQRQDEPDAWAKVDADKIVFEHLYDLSALFEQFDVLKISTVAKIAGMNASLLRQYVTHQKYPGKNQAKKIEAAIKDIAQRLSKVAIYA